MRTTVLLTWVLSFVVVASARPQSKTYQQGTILSVEKQELNHGVSYRKATDAPLRSTAFVYDISVQINNTVFVGRYQSAMDYLPSDLAQGESMSVSIQNHRMYLKEPVQDLELNIVSHRRVRGSK